MATLKSERVEGTITKKLEATFARSRAIDYLGGWLGWRVGCGDIFTSRSLWGFAARQTNKSPEQTTAQKKCWVISMIFPFLELLQQGQGRGCHKLNI